MFGATKLAVVLGAIGRDVPRTPALYAAFARAITGLGLPTLLIEPGGKRPLDMRTTTERAKDSEQHHNSGGVHLATTDRRVLEKYIKRAVKDPAAKRAKTQPTPVGDKPLNFAVKLAGSGYVVADADTPAEVACLQAFLAQHYGEGRTPGPTILTPGSHNQAHHGGGHWWFELPEGLDVDPALIPSVSKITMPGHDASFSLYSGNAYVLVPPSQRAEGFYEFVGLDTPATPQLVDFLQDALFTGQARQTARAERLERLAHGTGDTFDEQVSAWNQATPWTDILAPAGWVDAGFVDGCGCEVWTAPGSHSSPKSATAHEASCTQPHIDPINPPVHIWTDSPGVELEAHIRERGTKTVSKLTTFALLHHDGDMGAALRAADITAPLPGFGESDETPATTSLAGATTQAVRETVGSTREGALAATGGAASEETGVMFTTLDTGAVLEGGSTWVPPRPPIDLTKKITTPGGLDMWEAWGVSAPEDEDEAASRRAKMPPFGSLRDYRDRPAPEYIIDGLLEHGGLTSILGASGVGKSAVALDMAAHICTGRSWHGRETIKTNTLYVAGEGVTGAISRLHAWEKAHECTDIEDSLFIVEEAVLFGSGADNWAYLARQIRDHDIGLVIFDTLARMSTGLDENSATDMGTAVTIFDRLRRTTGAGVCFIHHSGKAGTSARGSSALKGALDSEVLITDTMVDGSEFHTVNGVPVSVDGAPLPGKPLCVQVTKQKNGEDGIFEYICLTRAFDSVVITDIEGRAEAPSFGEVVTDVARARVETPEELVQPVIDFVNNFTSGDVNPTVADIARGITPRHPDITPARLWSTLIRLALDKAVSDGKVFKHKQGFMGQPPLE